MSDPDLKTLAAISGLISLVLGLVLLGLRRQLPSSIQGLNFWGAAPLVGTASVVFYALSGHAPEAVVIVGGDGLLLLCSLCYYAGTRKFCGGAVDWRLWGGLVAACLAALLFFLWVAPDYRMRQASFNATIAALALAQVRLLFNHRPGFAVRFTGGVILVYSLVQVLRGVSTFWIDAPDTDRFAATSAIHTLYLAGYSFMGTLMAVGVQFMTAERIHQEFEYQASHDSLTGALTRRAWMRAMEDELQRWQRHGQPLSLLVLDLDHFKRINDTHGHLAGDRVLTQAAKAARDTLRAIDKLGRYGGEEFIVLLPATDAAAALLVAERLRAAVKADAAAGSGPACTVSIGVSSVQSAEDDFPSLFARADAALYRAKQAGRDRVEAG